MAETASVLGWSGATPGDAYLRRTYGISRADYDRLYAYQGGRCFVCHRKPVRTPLAVDHDHAKGKGRQSVRGLLCGRSGRDSRGRDYPACNRVVGMWQDNPNAFRRAADYLTDPPWQRIVEADERERLREAHDALNDEYFAIEQDWENPE